MSDKSKQPETEERRRPIADPRLHMVREEVPAARQAAAWSGWAAGLALVVMLFWMAIASKFGLGPKIVLAAAVVLGAFWLRYHLDTLRTIATGRGARLGTNSALFAVFVLGVLILINVIGARHHLRKDLTENKLFSLSDQTRQVVSKLDKDVGMIAFVQPGKDSKVDDLLREYSLLSPKLKVEKYDPMTNPEKVRQYEITMSPTIVVTSGERKETVVGGDEQQLTSAILSVTKGEKTKIYFLIGHGEDSPDDSGARALQALKANLENQQYECRTLALATQQEPMVPADCAVLVIAGPTQPIPDKEMRAIEDYANQSGKLLVALEPSGPDLSALLEPHGVRPLKGTVIDPSHGWFGATHIPMVTQYEQHGITAPMSGVAVALPTTRALEVLQEEQPEEPPYPGAPPPPTQKAQPLLESSADAWLETATSGVAQKEPGELSGPLVMAAAVDEGQQPPNPYGMPEEQPSENALRMVVLGDADMMTDEVANIGLQGNIYFVLNAINWLTENEKLISIPPKQDAPRYMTMSSGQLKLVWALTVFIVPLLILVAGTVVWWRRR